jgi:hypothetical protein
MAKICSAFINVDIGSEKCLPKICPGREKQGHSENTPFHYWVNILLIMETVQVIFKHILTIEMVGT